MQNIYDDICYPYLKKKTLPFHDENNPSQDMLKKCIYVTNQCVHVSMKYI